MAATSQTVRKIILPLSDVANNNAQILASKIPANFPGVVIVDQRVGYFWQAGVLNDQQHTEVTIICTPAQDAAIFALLPQLQTAVGAASPLPTWTETVTYGY